MMRNLIESIFWTAGMNPLVSVMQSTDGVVRIITAHPFSPALQLKLIEKYKVNVIFNSPSKFIACVKSNRINQANLSSVTSILLYGNKPPNNLVADAMQFFTNAKFASLYAMTELGPISKSILDAQAHSSMNSGLLVPGKIVKIIDEDGNRCGPNVTGEICIKSQNEFLGYLNDPETNAATIDDEGFFRTGDGGHFDENAHIIFDERIKNILRVYHFRGEVIPTEIEDFLLKMPDILDACVVGIPAGVGNAVPAAVIVKRRDSNLSQNDIYNAVSENFNFEQRLRGGVYFEDSFAKTLSGKAIRKEITELASKMFKSTRDNEDAEIHSYLSDIPEEFRKFISYE